MPSYFYHISLQVLPEAPELCADPSRLNATSASKLSPAVARVREALSPFKQPHGKTANGGGRSRKTQNHKNNNKSDRISEFSDPNWIGSTSTTAFADSRNNNTSLQCPASEKPSFAEETHTHPNPNSATTGITTTTSDLLNDQRLSSISVESIDMVLPHERGDAPQQKQQQPSRDDDSDTPETERNNITKGIGDDALASLATKGKYVPLDHKTSESSIWGVVHLYRDAEDTPSLHDQSDLRYSLARHASLQLDAGGSASSSNGGRQLAYRGVGNGGSRDRDAGEEQVPPQDCTMLCILAVPLYLSPPDFLAIVGEETRDAVSHFRMIRTSRANRYMVLMKFRSGTKAREWQKEWNGKVVNSLGLESYHVVFVKSIDIQASTTTAGSSFPDVNNNPFTPSTATSTSRGTSSGYFPAVSLTTKPIPPRTPALVELPTCPVCLERMDETTGLFTIMCQHVFHCKCLQRWKGCGCPVCRFTHDGPDKLDEGPAECNVCHSEVNLWVCLLCGNVGCGRYDEAHAFAHHQETGHAFAMDIATQRVWDYVGDGYVHRIIQNKADGKLVELPAADSSALDPPDWADAVPREKFENMALEYTHLLTSQLESQRTYFEEKVERAADKASQASAAALSAQEAVESITSRFTELQTKHDELANETIPDLERSKARADRRADKFETMSRKLEKEWREEKAMNENLRERVELLQTEVQTLKAANEDLTEQNRDLTFFISSSEKLKDQGEDVVEGTVSVPEQSASGGGGKKKRKGKGKGKG